MTFRHDSDLMSSQKWEEARPIEGAKVQEQDEVGTHIPPWYILAGLSKLDRSAVCDMLAISRCLSVSKLAIDKVRDWTCSEDPGRSDQSAFQKRIRSKSLDLNQQPKSDDALRFQLWSETRNGLGLHPALPLSTGIAQARCAEVTSYATRHFKHERTASQSARPTDFSGIVRAQVRKAVHQALQGEALSPEQRQAVEREFRQKLADLPENLRDTSLQQAMDSGDWVIAASLVSTGSLMGLGIAVEVAGFAAYIAAAQASAIIPLLGGEFAVSTLAVAANPLFIIPAVMGSYLFANKTFRGSVHRRMASATAVQLAVLGLAVRERGLQRCLDGFKRLTERDCDPQIWSRRQRVAAIAEGIPDTPSAPDVELPAITETGLGDAVNAVLFPYHKRSGTETLAVGGMVTADLLFEVAAIDPRVVAAADFSRAENLEDIFRFGAFADRITGMDEAARVGAEISLRGYFAEMVVATRLQGHEVSLPDTANNPGVDLFVDGHPFQVKCFADSNTAMTALREHFGRYPQVPVYVNSEVLPTVQESGEPWAEDVFAVEGFDYETTNQVVLKSLEAGADLDDLNIPLFTVAASVARNLHGWWKGSVPLSDLPSEIIIDSAVHGGLSVAGGFTGAAIGGLVFGPAGAVVGDGVGGIASLFGSSRLGRSARRLVHYSRVRFLQESVARFHRALATAMLWKIKRKREKIAELESALETRRRWTGARAARMSLLQRLVSYLRRFWEWLVALLTRSRHTSEGISPAPDATPDQAVARWMRLKFEDQVLCVAECLAETKHLAETGCFTKDPERSVRELLRLMRESCVHPLSVKPELAALVAALGGSRASD